MENLSGLDISELNVLTYEEFIERIGNVVEHGSVCAAAVWENRPFHDVHHLHREICSFIDLLPDIGKKGLLRLHPDLAGRLTELGGLTQESAAEQLAAGINTLTLEEKRTLVGKNEMYKEKFGFPFVICAKHNKKDAILKGIAERLENSDAVEWNNGIEEVKKICFLRLLSIVSNDNAL